ncbi:MAG: RNA polymerase factor sigma-54 [Alphaproteobacteria bacterium]|nr:RNA polymerase factor sigma-54 [Alphaproteobacteria bacterium]MDE2630465.1 RNA polymerase factor sigma-54 [Alphaproteobacteria bacterium]
MAISQRLEIRQGQTLVMTPQLQQAIKLLQLSNVELAEYCEQELEKNPLLERDESAPSAEPEREPAEREAPDEPLEASLAREDFSKCEAMDTSHDNLYDNDEPPAASVPSAPLADWTTVKAARSFDGDEDLLESTVAGGGTLKDHLLEQLAIAALDADKRLICVSLIDAVDEAGYLRVDLGELAERLGAEPAAIEVTLTVLQGFDPVGVGARDLAECLALQLKDKDRFDPAMQAMVAHLDLVAKRDAAQLAQVCGVDAADIADMIAELRALSPKPGLSFNTEPVQPVVPDVIVRDGHDGGWTVELNSDTLPRLLVSARYYAKVSAHARDKESRTYLTECLNNANWLVKSLDQRARTIMKVASEIVRQQDGFLTYGVRHLRPLNLRTIADAIGMHESTVSRVTSNKYIATPRGLFELKYFFTAAIQSLNGAESHSAEAVRDRIREMVEREGTGDVLSDDRIVSLLTADGVNIARRTVAKYREAMRIPSSVERRRLKGGEPVNPGIR